MAARARVKAWREANPERAKAAIAKSKAAKPEKYKALQRAFYLKNIDARKKYSAAWRIANPKKMSAMLKKWLKENPHRRREIANNWRKNNQDKVNAVYARRRAAKLRAVPAWANNFFIQEAYSLARLRTKMLGYPWHVDHIVPLMSPIVCGLHVHDNLRVIPGSINQSKNNRHWPDMPNG